MVSCHDEEPAAANLLGCTFDEGRMRFVKLLGTGSGGVVFLATEETGTSSPASYAVKCIVKARYGSSKHQSQWREIDNHRAVSSHPNVVTLHRIVEEAHFLFLVMDYCPGGDLFSFLVDGKTFSGDVARIKNIFGQLIDALAACHKAGIYHRDVKPENVLCNADCTKVYLADFGLSTTTAYSQNFAVGSFSYMSPECIHYDVKSDCYSSRRNDIWALGPILTIMISGRNPWMVAVAADDSFVAYLRDPHFLHKMLPISEGANLILRHIFTRKEKNRISLEYLRQLVLQLDTFFMTPDEIARAHPCVQEIAETYFRKSQRQLVYHDTNTSYGAELDEMDGRRVIPHVRKLADEVGSLSKVPLESPKNPHSEIQEILRSQDTNPTSVPSDGSNGSDVSAPQLPALPAKIYLPPRHQRAPPTYSPPSPCFDNTMSTVIPPAIPDFTGQVIDGRLQLLEVIGEGAHGVVYRAVEVPPAGSSPSPNPTVYAVKVQYRGGRSTRKGQAQAREIVTHMIASDHPNVLTLHGVIEDDQFVFLVTDYCPGGDLFTVMIEQKKYARDDYIAKKIFLQILDAVESCHAKGIYHRDLKPDNIFLNADATEIYLGDFGLATDVKRCHAHGCGSAPYMSPECIGLDFNFGPYSPKRADIWALGVILTNLITGRNPWTHAIVDDGLFSRYLADSDFIRKVLPISKGANEILKRVFSFNPYTRISIAELREAITELDTFFMSEEEIAGSNELVKGAAAYYFTRSPSETSADVERVEQADGATGYPNILPEDAYAFVSPDSNVAPPSPPALLSASRIFTIGSASDDSSSSSSSGSLTGSSGTESTGPHTPEAHAVDDAELLALSNSETDGFTLSQRMAEPTQKGPTPIHCLVQGIDEIVCSF
ncbi:hypothetical protein EUX98_g1635 [Antrodiella citrinella]|uniref:Protein kinase domain-containing protein n=1 Tax=Antrodiella citrinella TaxID=2447956 RepID=A0A4S4N3Z9_9APHY|nr:hypothetical protein EUX98_g1635 [Antrodiella citrinella]